MKLGSLLIHLQGVEHKVAIYEDVIDYLGREDLEIPVESGVAPASAIQAVVEELEARKAQLENQLEAAEDVEIGDVELEDLSGGGTPD
jgi:hypothetical protein